MSLFFNILSEKLIIVIPAAGAVFAVLLFWLYRQCRRKQITSLFGINLASAAIGLLLPLFSRLDAEITPELMVTVLIIITIVLLASSIYALFYKAVSQAMPEETDDQQEKQMMPDEAEADIASQKKAAAELAEEVSGKEASAERVKEPAEEASGKEVSAERAKELAEEAAYYQKAVAAFTAVVGQDAPDTALSYFKLAGVYYQLDDYHKAYDCLIKAAAIREKVYGRQHPDTLQAYCWLEKTCWALADENKALEYRRLQSNNAAGRVLPSIIRP